MKAEQCRRGHGVHSVRGTGTSQQGEITVRNVCEQGGPMREEPTEEGSMVWEAKGGVCRCRKAGRSVV